MSICSSGQIRETRFKTENTVAMNRAVKHSFLFRMQSACGGSWVSFRMEVVMSRLAVHMRLSGRTSAIDGVKSSTGYVVG
jgi:glycine cleavage system regulatory protein